MSEVYKSDGWEIPIYDDEEIAKIRKACQLASETLDYITPFVEVGITTAKLNDLMYQFIKDNGAISATIGYGEPPYPAASCISLNHVVCHGIPSDKKLKNGDILNIDMTVILDGYFGDTSRMFYAGTPSIKAQRLVETTFECMWAGINQVKPKAHLGDIGAAIQELAESHRYGVVRDFVGHGVGRTFHHDPQVFHFGQYGQGVELKEGMIFTIEPMINAGKPHTKILNDGWTAVTRDRSLSAQFEHTILVTKDGFEALTLSPKELHKPKV
ncbi:MAG: type I methionyl aminopeptidase [Alphaproteobacteria bacterium]